MSTPVVLQDYPRISGIRVDCAVLIDVAGRDLPISAWKMEDPPTAPTIAELAPHARVPIFGGLGRRCHPCVGDDAALAAGARVLRYIRRSPARPVRDGHALPPVRPVTRDVVSPDIGNAKEVAALIVCTDTMPTAEAAQRRFGDG